MPARLLRLARLRPETVRGAGPGAGARPDVRGLGPGRRRCGSHARHPGGSGRATRAGPPHCRAVAVGLPGGPRSGRKPRHGSPRCCYHGRPERAHRARPCAAAIKVRSAELTGAGESVQVRREGKANHYFHREPCGRTREGAVEASVAARVAGMIEHRKRYDPERRGFLIDRRQHLQSRHGEGLPGSALSEESRDARTPLYRDSGGLQFASAVVPGPRKKGDNPNR